MPTTLAITISDKAFDGLVEAGNRNSTTADAIATEALQIMARLHRGLTALGLAMASMVCKTTLHGQIASLADLEIHLLLMGLASIASTWRTSPSPAAPLSRCGQPTGHAATGGLVDRTTAMTGKLL